MGMKKTYRPIAKVGKGSVMLWADLSFSLDLKHFKYKENWKVGLTTRQWSKHISKSAQKGFIRHKIRINPHPTQSIDLSFVVNLLS